MKDFSWLYDKPIAHRGLHNDKIPENSLASFQNAIDKGYNIEIDVHLLPDGDFAVFHDTSLKRMCGVKQKLRKLNAGELQEYKLKGTKEHIPTLKEVLELVDGKTGILIENKLHKGQIIGKKLYEYIENCEYSGDYAIQCFSPSCLIWFRNNTENIPLGQLSLNYAKYGLIGLLGRYLSNGSKRKKVKPDFISFDVNHLPYSGVTKQKNKGLKVLAWTVNSAEKLQRAKNFADNFIFEKEELLK